MSKTYEPKVSIIIPVYNGANFLAEAIDSAISQDYNNCEILVINDGSTDNGETEEIALSYGEKIRYIKKENGGVSSALNFGIREMTGDYFSWLSHDDLYTKTKIRDAIEQLRNSNQLGEKTIAYTTGMFIDVKGKNLYPLKNPFERGCLYSGIDIVKHMTKKGTLNGCCMLIPRATFDEVGMFDETLRYSQDSLMWYRIFLKNYNLISDGHMNVMSRIHDMQVTQTRRDLYENDALIIAKILAKPLSEMGPDIFMSYVNRQLKHQCKTTINYLLEYAKDRNLFSCIDTLRLRVYMVLGSIRYKLAKAYKRMLIMIRSTRGVKS